MTNVNTVRPTPAPVAPSAGGATNGTKAPDTDVAGTPAQCRALRDSTATDAYADCLRLFASAPSQTNVRTALAPGGSYGVNT